MKYATNAVLLKLTPQDVHMISYGFHLVGAALTATNRKHRTVNQTTKNKTMKPLL